MFTVGCTPASAPGSAAPNLDAVIRRGLSFSKIAVVLIAVVLSSSAAAGAPAQPAPAPAGVKPEIVPPHPRLEPLPAGAIAILGKKVHGPKGEDLGLLTDIVFDDDGNPVAAIIDFGGFLGVGTRKLAIDWKLLRFTPSGKNGPLEVNLDRAEIEAAPEYQPDAKSPKMIGPPVPSVPALPDVSK